MRRIVFAAVMILALSGCGPQATEKGFRTMVNSYAGQHIDSLVAAWGPPQASYTYEDGRREYSFVHSRLVERMVPEFTFGGYYGYPGWWGGYAGFPMYRERIRQYRCETRVATDRKGRITNITYRGNDCRALEVKSGLPPSAGDLCAAGSSAGDHQKSQP